MSLALYLVALLVLVTALVAGLFNRPDPDE